MNVGATARNEEKLTTFGWERAVASANERDAEAGLLLLADLDNTLTGDAASGISMARFLERVLPPEGCGCYALASQFPAKSGPS